MAVQNPPVKGGFEPPVMFFSAVVTGSFSTIEEVRSTIDDRLECIISSVLDLSLSG
jgi:hypothetical protein